MRYTLKTPYRDGTTHVVFEPPDFIARLAALVPKPRVQLTRYHGVFAPHSRWRAQITLMWWSLWLIAAAGGAWWTFFGPLLLTFPLLKVSGVALTEKDIASRRPEYRDYIRRTSAFVPLPPRT